VGLFDYEKEKRNMTRPNEISVGTDIHVELPKEKFKQLEEFIESLETTEGALIEILHYAQNIFGFLPRDVQLFIARKLGIPGSEVYGVVSFYSYFTTKPQGKHSISVCTGTACFVRGAGKILDKVKANLGTDTNETTKDGEFTLRNVRCIGACGLAPVITVDDKVHGRIMEEDVDAIVKSYNQNGGIDED
jgi:NADH-quinone oxidoreductase subunit E/NADP-reducing hydrogenase subunit HndA